jgi:hypothetical protein
MHLIWENCIPNLILHWTGEFKGLDDGKEDYEIQPKVWEAIGKATANSGSTIPSAFGARPPNFTTSKLACTAETWTMWTLFIGPVLLRRRFAKQRYYKHFIQLVKLLNICLQFKITASEIQLIREGFIEWVKDYEKYVPLIHIKWAFLIDIYPRIYYQHNPARLSACPVTIHALLHIADGIKGTGPIWASWAFPTERYCGSLTPAIKSRRFPYSSLDRYVTEVAQLTQIQMFHQLDNVFDLRPPKGEHAGHWFSDEDCKYFILSSFVY